MDLNARAFRTVQVALSEPSEYVAPNPRKQSSRKGGLAGGPSRAKSISAERRSTIARQASQARWAKRKIAESPSA